MEQKQARRKRLGPGVALSFTAPADEVAQMDDAAMKKGLTRAAFFYAAVAKETRRVLRKTPDAPLAQAS